MHTGWLRVGLGALMAVSLATPLPARGAPAIVTVAKADQYFPDTPGSRWRYRGQVIEGALQKIATQAFVNVSTVKGTESIKGVTVKVFHDTNPGNHGPSDSYYRRDAAGIVYYGSEPGTPLEKQLIPYQIVRFPLEWPSTFQQFDRKGVNFGSDLDGDEKPEQSDVQASVTVVGTETVVVPAGTYQDAVRIEARMTLRIHLSGSSQTAVGTDTMTAWFARGVGLVKYVEHQEIPRLKTDRGLVTEITEELEEVQVKTDTALHRRCEPSADGVFADHTGHHELGQVVLAAGLRPHAGETVSSKRLAAHQRSGDGTIDIQVAHREGLAGCQDVPGTP